MLVGTPDLRRMLPVEADNVKQLRSEPSRTIADGVAPASGPPASATPPALKVFEYRPFVIGYHRGRIPAYMGSRAVVGYLRGRIPAWMGSRSVFGFRPGSDPAPRSGSCLIRFRPDPVPPRHWIRPVASRLLSAMRTPSRRCGRRPMSPADRPNPPTRQKFPRPVSVTSNRHRLARARPAGSPNRRP